MSTLKTLHIVDGESTGGSLRLSGLAKRTDILRWKDALYTGPVPARLSLRELSKVRSRFWTGAASEFQSRDAHLDRYRDYSEVVLWFGFTSLCQLSLVQLLSWFAEQKADVTRIALVACDGGSRTPKQFFAAYDARQQVTREQVQTAARVWQAFREPAPVRLAKSLHSNLRCLPDLRDALLEILQEYPGTADGLSRFERMLLRSVQSYGTAKAARAVGDVIIRYAIGDVLLFDMLRRFVSAEYPLLRIEGNSRSSFRTYKFNSAMLTLTDVGAQVLAGKHDNIALNGINRWIGGVHLNGKRVNWRWDEQLYRLLRTKD